MSDAFQDLMGRMKTAVDNSKTAREHVKKASIADLEEPGDILASTIYGMNDELERTAFPEEYAAKHAMDDTSDADDDDASKEAAEYDSEGAEDAIDEITAENSGKKAVPDSFKAHMKGEKEAGFGRSVEEDLSNPLVAAGFNAELAEHEPAIKQAMATILSTR